MIHQLDPIVALATAPGIGAIAVIRVSGKGAIALTNRAFRGKDLTEQASHTAHFGTFRSAAADTVIDEVVITVFQSPTSFTKEDVTEISGLPMPLTAVKALSRPVPSSTFRPVVGS